MRTILGLVIGAAVAVATLTGATAPRIAAPVLGVALGQAGPPTTVDPRLVTISWQPPETRVDGSPVGAIAAYMVAYWPAVDDPATDAPMVEVDAGSGTVLSLASLVSASTPPGAYQVSVRAIDEEGYSSTWATPIVQTWTLQAAPGPPQAVRVILVLNPDGTVRWEETE